MTDVGSVTALQTGGMAYRAARSEPPACRPTWAEVDTSAIRDNVAALKTHAGGPQLMAVVKADGYGHGAVPAARAALAGGADWLGVALVEEGVILRRAGIGAPILLLSEPPCAAIDDLLDARLTATVYTAPFVDALAEAARARHDGPVDVHLKLDTGMRRVGVPPADWEDALRRLAAVRGLRLAGLWSHLAVADQPDHPFNAIQVAELRRGTALAASLGLDPPLVHLANSAAAVHLPDTVFDLVRTGVAIYGLDPAPGVALPLALRPALSWYSRLSLVKRLAAGESVSYGLRWTAPRDTTVATVPAGYADGVSRLLGNRGAIVARGRRLPMVGTVCMDQFLVDGGDGELASGDDVCLIGEQDGTRVSAEDWAAWLGTINYEVVCGIGQRVPRVYVSEAV